MSARGHPDEPSLDQIPLGWTQVTSFNALGHIIQNSGAITDCVNATLAAAWRAFWANIGGKRSRNISTKHKLSVFTRCVTPALRLRWARWPFTKSLADRLDRTQRKMFRSVFRLVRLPAEDDAAYSRRSARYVSGLQIMVHPWSHLWAESTILWCIHVSTNRAHACWPSQILDIRSASELRHLRSLNAGRPQTRLVSGFCCKRWSEGVDVAFSYLLASKRVEQKLDEFEMAQDSLVEIL